MMTSRPHLWILLLTALVCGGIGGWLLHSVMRQESAQVGGGEVSKKTAAVQPRVPPAAAASKLNGSETADAAAISLPPAGSAAFADIIRGTFRDPLKERRLGRLQILLEKCGPEHLAAMIPLIRENDLRGTSSGDEWSLLWSQWGQKSGAAALAAIQAQDWKGWDPAAPAEAQSRSVSGWAALDPAAARAWLESTQDKIYPGGPLSKALLAGWSVTDPAAAASWLRQRGKGTPEEYRAVMEAMSRKNGPEAVEAWLASAGSGGDAAGLHGFADAVSAAKRRQDPAAAAAWVEQHLKEPWIQGSPVVSNTAWAYAERDPEKAMEWASRSGLESAAGIVMQRWCDTDPAAASGWLQDHHDSPGYGAAVTSLVNRFRKEDPEAARKWAETIPDAGLRARVLATIPQE